MLTFDNNLEFDTTAVAVPGTGVYTTLDTMDLGGSTGAVPMTLEVGAANPITGFRVGLKQHSGETLYTYLATKDAAVDDFALLSGSRVLDFVIPAISLAASSKTILNFRNLGGRFLTFEAKAAGATTARVRGRRT